MRKIINDLVYDTVNSYLINVYHDCFYSILSHYSIYEDLYLTKNNRFFIHKYESELVFLSYNTYEDLIALTTNEAFEYMKKYCPEKIEHYFKIKDA